MRHFNTIGLFVLLPFFLSAQITIQIIGTNVSCFGGNNGSARATPNGGVAPYNYLWSNGVQLDAIANLPMGSYTVTVSDQAGNSSTKSVEITQPPLLGATLNGQPQICNVAPDGFTYAIPTGGTPPCSYKWSNGVQLQLNNHLTANNYSVTVTDNRGCTATGSFTVGYLGIGLYLFTDSTNATCPQPNNGMASVTVLSGNGPYQYQWSNNATTPVINNLQPGTYDVSVSDVNGCAASMEVTVEREDLDPTLIDILIPQCTQQRYGFESQEGYHQYNWVLNNPEDIIVSGNGSRQIEVQWNTPGSKEISLTMRDSITQCTTAMFFKVNVNACAVATSESSLDELQVSPNPFNGYIAVQTPAYKATDVLVELFSLQGLPLVSQHLTGSNTIINTQDIPPGIYLMKVSDGIKTLAWKVLK